MYVSILAVSIAPSRNASNADHRGAANPTYNFPLVHQVSRMFCLWVHACIAILQCDIGLVPQKIGYDRWSAVWYLNPFLSWSQPPSLLAVLGCVRLVPHTVDLAFVDLRSDDFPNACREP